MFCFYFQQPVVLTDTNLVSSALQWDEAYLRTHIGNGKFTVFTSDSHKFLYYDDKKMKFVPNFKPPTRHLDLTFDQFIDKLENNSESKWYACYPSVVFHILEVFAMSWSRFRAGVEMMVVLGWVGGGGGEEGRVNTDISVKRHSHIRDI